MLTTNHLRLPAAIEPLLRPPLERLLGRIRSLRFDQWLLNSLIMLSGFGLLLVIWQLVASINRDLPGPIVTLPVLWAMIRDPFYDNGPNDKGIGIQVLYSLGRVFTGWSLGSLIAIPVGLVMGSNRTIMRVLNPVVQILRPVSPLAWYPIGLAVYQNAAHAVVFAIVITSLWPTLINTMVGVAALPDDYRNVARVFNFSPWKIPHQRTLALCLDPYPDRLASLHGHCLDGHCGRRDVGGRHRHWLLCLGFVECPFPAQGH